MLRLAILLLSLIFGRSILSEQLNLSLSGSTSNSEKNKLEFIPDTSLSTILFLLNGPSVLEAVGPEYESSKIDGEALLVSNSLGNEYAVLGPSYGGIEHEALHFEVFGKGYADTVGLIRAVFPPYFLRQNEVPPIALPADHFESESGIRLGINKHDLIERKGNPNRKNAKGSREVLMYHALDGEEAAKAFQKRRGILPDYRAEYYFLNDRLVRMVFGFEYP